MKSKILKGTISLIMATVIFVGSCLSANAYTTYYSSWTNKSGYQYNYRFRASIANPTDYAVAGLHCETTNGSPVPAGYMGVNAFLFTGDGVNCWSTGMSYNSYATSSKSVYKSRNISGYYYGEGLISVPTSSSNGQLTYTTFGSKKTTTIYCTCAYSPAGMNPPTQPNGIIGVTPRGETYGSLVGFCLGEYDTPPDLVSTIGSNGIQGYVKYTDLVYTPTSPEDAVRYTLSLDELTIPVYDLDGRQIDIFAFGESTSNGSTF